MSSVGISLEFLADRYSFVLIVDCGPAVRKLSDHGCTKPLVKGGIMDCLSKNCTHGYRGRRYKFGSTEYTSCPLCEIEAKNQHKAAQAIAREFGFDPTDENFAKCVGAILRAWELSVGVPNR
jgi:hypothetical protein